MRLIDANDLYTRFEEIGWWDNEDRDVAEDLLDEQKIFDAVPVVHAHWIYKFTENGKYDYCKCSMCGKVNRTVTGTRSKYCGECGAKMDEKTEEKK